jgi:hypothetical protein
LIFSPGLQIQAGHGARTPDHANHRHGYRRNNLFFFVPDRRDMNPGIKNPTNRTNQHPNFHLITPATLRNTTGAYYKYGTNLKNSLSFENKFPA